MDLLEAIKSRKSIRGYKAVPVPKETLAQILEIATRAPSPLNTQPWKFAVLGGEVLDKLKKAFEERYLAGVEPHPDFGREPALTGVYRSRQVEVGKALFQLMDIAREDKEKRNQWTLKMIRFFDAPNAIIISIDEEISEPLFVFGLGTISDTIALAALDFGLGTIIEQAVVYYPEVIRQFTGIPESQKIAVGIGIGYPDWDFPANKLQSTREPLANITSWHGV